MTNREHPSIPAAALLAGLAILLPASGPLADEPSAPLELEDAISAVTVYSDQAAVTRSASVRLEAGRHQVAFEPLPPGAWPATVQVDADGAEILAVEVLPPWPVEPGDEWVAQEAALALLERQLSDLETPWGALRWEARLLTTLGRHPVRKEGELGTELLPSTKDDPVGRWQQQRLDSLADEAEQLRETARGLGREYEELARAMTPQRNDGRLRVVATLSLARAATVKLSATTRVGGPRWVPDYDLHLDAEAGLGRVAVNALVSQSTGEDWRGVPLRLSTATPGAAANLPKLAAWYLEEQAPPEPEPEAEYYEEEKAVMAEAPRRSKSKKSAPRARSTRGAAAPAEYDSYPVESLQLESAGAMRRGGGGMAGGSSSRSSSSGSSYGGPAPAPASRMVVNEPPTDLLYRLLGPPPSGMPLISPPHIVVPPPTGPAVDWARFDPARQAGGFDYAMQSAGNVDIPADGVARRIPLLTLELPARFEHRVPAVVQEAGWLYALLKQDGQAPLLSGEARVFQSGDLLGNTTLPMSARGATFEVPLGKDEQLRVERKVDEVADRSGPIAGGESLSRTVTLKVRNLRPDAVHAVITDRVPVTYQDGMKVQIVEAPSPAAAVGKDGLIEWTVDLAAGADVTLTFSYLIRHPRNTALREQ